MEEQENKDIFELFSEFTWSDRLSIDRNSKIISIIGREDVIFEIKKGKNVLKFFLFDDETKEIKVRMGHPLLIEYPLDISPTEILEFWNNTTTGNSIFFKIPYL